MHRLAVGGQPRFKLPYAAFPVGKTVAQGIKPYPQFPSGLSPMWAPPGNNWYDASQMNAMKNYSHGLDFTASLTWSKELVTCQGVNDVFNRANQKSLAITPQPFLFVVGFNYGTPKPTQNKIIRHGVGRWTVGGVIRYTSGLPINRILMPTPSSGNPVQTSTRNPITGVQTFGFGRIDANSVSGQRNGQIVARVEW